MSVQSNVSEEVPYKWHKSEHAHTCHCFKQVTLSDHEHGEFSIGNWGTYC